MALLFSVSLPIFACSDVLSTSEDDSGRVTSSVGDDLRNDVLSWVSTSTEQLVKWGIGFGCQTAINSLLDGGTVDDFLATRKTIMFYRGYSAALQATVAGYVQGTDTVWDLVRYQATVSSFTGENFSTSVGFEGDFYHGIAFGGESVLDYNGYAASGFIAFPFSYTLGPFNFGAGLIGFAAGLDGKGSNYQNSLINPFTELDWNGVYGGGIESDVSSGLGMSVVEYESAFYETNLAETRKLCPASQRQEYQAKNLKAQKVTRSYCKFGQGKNHEENAILTVNSMMAKAPDDTVAGLVGGFAIMLARYRDSWAIKHNHASALAYACNLNNTSSGASGR